MFLGYQNDLIAFAANTREELENNFMQFDRVEETQDKYELINGEYRKGGLTIEEQNEAIRQTREELYYNISDKIKQDYDEAVARGLSNVEQLKQEWLASKDKIREENPYIDIVD